MLHRKNTILVLLLLLGSLLSPARAGADSVTCYLAQTGTDSTGSNCSQERPCRTIQFCLSLYPNPVDLTISLAPGTYGTENCGVTVGALSNLTSLTIFATPNTVVIDCDQRFTHFTFIRLPNTPFTLSGVTLRNGNSINDEGGCVCASYIQSLVIRDSSFQYCTSKYGGAVYSASPSSIMNSNFSMNVATSEGGALYLAPPDNGTRVTQCQIYGNAAPRGAAIFVEGDYLAVSGSNLTQNNASEYGGGVYVRSNSPETMGAYDFMGTTIANNWALAGGGLYSENLNHTWNVFGALFDNNVASDKKQTGDFNVACSSPTSTFCYACTATDCTSECVANGDQSCSQTSSPASVVCYGDKFDTCKSTDSCTCTESGLPKSAKILILLIAVCLFVGVVLILADVVRHVLRRRKHQYAPIK